MQRHFNALFIFFCFPENVAEIEVDINSRYISRCKQMQQLFTKQSKSTTMPCNGKRTHVAKFVQNCIFLCTFNAIITMESTL